MQQERELRPGGLRRGASGHLVLAALLLLPASVAVPQDGAASRRPEPTDVGPVRSEADVRAGASTSTRFAIIDVHEHVVDRRSAERLLRVMDQQGIRTVVLLGTPRYTFTLSTTSGFENYEEHNELMLGLARRYPGRFLAFPTIDPASAGNLARVQRYVAEGAAGLKLYLGHGTWTGQGPFHVMALDDARMIPLYRWAEQVQLPLMYHVNLLLYRKELERVLERFPRLRICLPHWGLHKNDEERLEVLAGLLARYPNVYIDISLGWQDYHLEGFARFSEEPALYRAFVMRHADRILFGSDMVLDGSEDEDFLAETLRSYRLLLETGRYRFFLDPSRRYRGLDLPVRTLRQIYETSARAFLQLDEQQRPPVRWRSPLPAQASAGPRSEAILVSP